MTNLTDLELDLINATTDDEPFALFDFLANNAHKLSKEELTRVAMELCYQVGLQRNAHDMLGNVASELKDWWE